MRKYVGEKLHRVLGFFTCILMIVSSSMIYVDAEELDESDVQEVDVQEADVQEMDVQENDVQSADIEVIDAQEEIEYELVNAAEYVDDEGFHYTLRIDGYYELSGYTGYNTYITLPEIYNNEDVISIAADFMNGNTSVTSIIMPNTYVEIGARAFKNCTNLTSIKFGEKEKPALFQNADVLSTTKLRRINESAFEGDYKLTEIDLSPNGLVYIGRCAFSGCSGITTLRLNASVKNIGEQAFYGCESINNLWYYGSENEWMSVVYDTASNSELEYASHPNYFAKEITFTKLTDAGYGYKKFEYYKLTTLSYTGGSTAIGNYCFANFKSITSADLSGVSSIGMGAFDNCTNLSTVTLSDNLSTLGANAFRNNSGLTQIYIGSGVKNIPAGVFSNCSNLKEITILNNVSNIGSDSFDGCDLLTTVNVVYNSYAHNYFKAKSNSYVFKYINGSGGTAVEDSVLDGTLVGYSAAFDGTIALKFYFKLNSDVLNDSSAVIRLVLPTETSATVNQDLKISQGVLTSDSTYVFTANIAPKFADSMIGAKIVRGNGTESKLYQISYLDYVKALMSIATDANAEAVKIARSLLTYCDACQTYFDFHTNSIPDGLLLETGLMSRCDATMFNPSVNDSGYIGISLELDSTMNMKFYFAGRRDDITFKFPEKTSLSPSSYVSEPEYFDGYTVYTVKGYLFGVNKNNQKMISLRTKVDIYSSGNKIGSTYGPYSFLYLATTSGNSKLQYLSDSIYTLNMYSTVNSPDNPIKK